MKLDIDSSTVVLAGRRFPAANAVCPPLGPDDTDSDRDRMLAGHGGPGIMGTATSYEVLIPCENGVLVSVEQYSDKVGYKVSLHSRACHHEPWDDQQILIPYFVSITYGELVAHANRNSRGAVIAPTGVWRWDDAEPEWIVELIDRINKMPFTQPQGPQVRLITLAEAEQLDGR